MARHHFLDVGQLLFELGIATDKVFARLDVEPEIKRIRERLVSHINFLKTTATNFQLIEEKNNSEGSLVFHNHHRIRLDELIKLGHVIVVHPEAPARRRLPYR